MIMIKPNTEFYEGAEFGLHSGEEIIITPKELLYYLNLICKKYCQDYLKNQEEILKWLEIYKDKNGISQ